MVFCPAWDLDRYWDSRAHMGQLLCSVPREEEGSEGEGEGGRASCLGMEQVLGACLLLGGAALKLGLEGLRMGLKGLNGAGGEGAGVEGEWGLLGVFALFQIILNVIGAKLWALGIYLCAFSSFSINLDFHRKKIHLNLPFTSSMVNRFFPSLS